MKCQFACTQDAVGTRREVTYGVSRMFVCADHTIPAYNGKLSIQEAMDSFEAFEEIPHPTCDFGDHNPTGLVRARPVGGPTIAVCSTHAVPYGGKAHAAKYTPIPCMCGAQAVTHREDVPICFACYKDIMRGAPVQGIPTTLTPRKDSYTISASRIKAAISMCKSAQAVIDFLLVGAE